MTRQLRINWLGKFKKILRNIKEKETALKMCIDAENQKYTIASASYGFSFNFNEDEKEFFRQSAGFTWEELSTILDMHDPKLEDGNVIVYLQGDNYVFENVTQQRFVLPIKHNYVIHTLASLQETHDEFTTRNFSTAVNVGYLKKVLSMFDNNDIVTISQQQDETIFKPKSALFVDNIGVMLGLTAKGVEHSAGKNSFVLPVRLNDALTKTVKSLTKK